MTIRLWVASTVSLFSLCTVAIAQVPSTAEPGRIEERFKPPPASQTTPEISIPRPEAPLPSAEAAKMHFRLTGIEIEGATAFKDTDFTALYQPLLGTEVTLVQIFQLSDAITAKYRRAGYILSQAIVPPQKIIAGVVYIRIIEGYIDQVTLKGDAQDDRGLIKEMGEKITDSRPLNVKVLERYVLLIGDIPGVAIRTVIKPSDKTPGAAELVLFLDRSPVSGNAQIDNRDSRAIGPVEGQVRVGFNSLFGADEQTSFLLATTAQPKELQYGQLSSDWLLDPEGTRLDLSGNYSDTQPGGPIAALDAIGHTLTLHALLDYPLIRSRSENLHINAGFTVIDSTVSLLGARFSDDRLRFLSANITYDVADTLLGDVYPATNIVTGELSQGLDVLDATTTGSPRLSRANGHSVFTRFYLEATRTQSLFDRTSIVLSAAGQVTGTPLLSPVQFGLGGSQFGRGYEPSELTGDDGLAGSVEGRYDLPFDAEIVSHPQLYAFYDIGQVWNIDALASTPASASLTSLGGGIRVTALGRFAIAVELAKPLTRSIASRGNKDIRPLFSISTNF